MKQLLPKYGIEVIEIERNTKDKMPVSASQVRKLLDEENISEVKKLVPEAVFEYLYELKIK